MTILLTLNMIKKHTPCRRGWITLLESLNKTTTDDEPITFSYIAKSNTVSDSLWCLRCIDTKEHKKEISLLLADIAESVLPIYEKVYLDDSRIRDCIEAIKRYANDEISKEKLKVFRNAAYTAANAAYTATNNVYAVTNAAYTAANVAISTVHVASAAIAHNYAYAACAADAAFVATSNNKQERNKQIELITKYLG